VTAIVPNGTLDGPDCTPLPFTLTFTKSADPGRVSATVSLVYAQQDSAAVGTASVRIEPGSSTTGSVSGQLDLCADRFLGEANLVKNTLRVDAFDGVYSFSAASQANFYVAKTPTAVQGFHVTRTAVKGRVTANTQRFGPIGADGRAVVWFRPPGDKLFKRLGIGALDTSGRFQIPTRARVPPKSQVKLNTTGCSWCKEVYAEARAPVTVDKPPKPSPATPSKPARQYYLSPGKTAGIAVTTSGRQTLAAFPAVRHSLFCFKGKQRKRPALGGGVMYIGKRMSYTMGKPTMWKTYWFSIETQPESKAIFEDPWNVDRPYGISNKAALVKQWGTGALKACGITR
jgi:hypothetical protein